MEAGGVAGQRRDVQRPGRGAAQDGKRDAEVAGVELGHGLEDTDLIGGAGTATGQQKRCIGSGHDATPYVVAGKQPPWAGLSMMLRLVVAICAFYHRAIQL
ncbi:hypothetical protein D3C81_1979180 [compost metagenome]